MFGGHGFDKVLIWVAIVESACGLWLLAIGYVYQLSCHFEVDQDSQRLSLPGRAGGSSGTQSNYYALATARDVFNN